MIGVRGVLAWLQHFGQKDVSVNSYLIQDLSKAWVPLDPKIEAGFWYFYYFLTLPRETALVQNPREIARVV
jgi:hypothetical protein